MIKKKKIILAITKGHWGGAQKYVYDLATNLPKELFEVKVIIGQAGELNQKLFEAQIPVVEIGKLKRDIDLKNDILSIKEIYRIIKTEKPDVLHLNSSKMGFLGTIIGRLLKVPKIIFTAHGWAFNENRPYWQKLLLKLSQQSTVLLSHRTISVSEQTKNQLGRMDCCQNKISVIRNGIGQINFLEKDRAVKQFESMIAGSLSEKFVIGCIAELHKNKGLNYLIDAIKLLKEDGAKNIQVIVIGEGEEKTKLQNQIDKYNLQPEIKLVGKIDQAARLLKAFNIFVLPSITEALPYVLLEAGQAGLPIICTRVGGTSEIIEDKENGLIIRPADTKDLFRSIKYLKVHPDKTLVLGQKIQDKIKESFSTAKMVEKTIALY